MRRLFYNPASLHDKREETGFSIAKSWRMNCQQEI